MNIKKYVPLLLLSTICAGVFNGSNHLINQYHQSMINYDNFVNFQANETNDDLRKKVLCDTTHPC